MVSVPHAHGHPSWPRFLPLFILMIGTAVYSNTLHASFVLDDVSYVLQSPAVKDFRYYWDSALADRAIAQKRLDQNFPSRKLAFLTFALNHRLHGPRVEGYHVVNLLIHLGNGLLVYGLVLATLRTPLFRGREQNIAPGPDRHLMALFAALFFVAHPVQTQAVTYISQRFTSLATMFYLLSLVFFVRWRLSLAMTEVSPARTALYWLALAAAVLAMFTKEIAFTLPLVLLGYEWTFFARPRGRHLLALVPFALTMLIIPAIVFGEGNKYEDVTRLSNSLPAGSGENQMLSYLLSQFRVIVTYLRLLLLPVNQNLDYDYPRYTSFFQAPVALSFLLLCLIAGSGIFLYRRSGRIPAARARWLRLTGFGIFWFFTTLSVESTVMPLRDLIFEHRLYLPSIGFFLALLGTAGVLLEEFNRRSVAVLICVLLMILATLSVATYARNSLWRDSIALGEDTIRKSPNKYRPRQNLAQDYFDRGRFAEALAQYQAALRVAVDYGERLLTYGSLENLYQLQNRQDLLRETYAAWQDLLLRERDKRPDDPALLNDLGIFYAKMGRLAEAEAQFLGAIKLESENAVQHLNLAAVYLEQGRKTDGLAALLHAARIDPDDDAVQESLGDELADQGNYNEALVAYLKALDLNPDSATLYTKIAGEYIRSGRLDEASQVLRRGTATRGYDPMTHNDLGLFLERTGHPAEAEQEFLQALGLNGDLPEVHLNMGLFYLGQGQADKALASLTRAERLDPTNPDVLFALGEAHTQRGEHPEAAAAFQQVLVLAPTYPDAARRLEQVRRDETVRSIPSVPTGEGKP